MLKSLAVTNFALIEQAMVEFDTGLNILTGETGAGKSILIDALNVILGNRASGDAIRTGCDFFRVEAVFDIAELPLVANLLAEQGIDWTTGEDLIINRRFTKTGKNTILVNGCQVPLSILRQLGDLLVGMHGQHENQALLQPETHQELLDTSAPTIMQLLQRYTAQYQRWQEVIRRRQTLEKNARERAQRLDMLQWQVKEIEAAQLLPEEEESLEQQIRVLANAEKIMHSTQQAYVLLNQGEQETPSVLSQLAAAKHELESALRYDDRLQAIVNSVSDALYQLEESCMELRDYCDNMEYDPQQLAVLQERMDLIYKLKKKYGSTIAEILEYYQQAQQELNELENAEDTIQELVVQETNEQHLTANLAEELTMLRRKTAAALSSAVSSQLKDLGMPKAVFEVAVSVCEELGADGQNDIIFLFSANPGEEAKPLHKIASGGELSRIALAIKTVCSHLDTVGSMVFDEVDAGIGGRTAQMVAEKISVVALEKQVLCITHLPQIACMADQHIYIEKYTEGGRTQTVFKILTEQEQRFELSRMIAGADVTSLAIDNATEMLETAQRKKEKWKMQRK